MPLLEKAFNIIHTRAIAFSGSEGQINHLEGQVTRAGKAISQAGALRVAAIWIATSLLADEVASLTQRIILKEDQKRTPQQPPDLQALWSDEPNPDQTRFGIDATETLSMALWGASYTMLGWTNGGKLDVRWPIDPDGISLDRLEDGGLKLTSPGQGELFNRVGKTSEFAFVPMYTLPGKLTPVSPVRMAAELAGLSQAYEEMAARFAVAGFNPSAVVTADEMVPTDIAKEISDRLTRLHGGASRAGGVAVIGGRGMKLERLTMSMVDAEVVRTSERVFLTLLAMWRVPPTVAGMVDKPSTWGTGVAEFSRGLERFTLRPIVQRRQAAHQKYITKWVNPNLQVKYLFDSLLSAAPKERSEVQRLNIMAGLTSIERELARNDEPPFDEEETVYSQLSLADTQQREFRAQQSRAEAIGAEAKAVTALRQAGVPLEQGWAFVNPEATFTIEEPAAPAAPGDVSADLQDVDPPVQ